jgi:hypothetical protein
MKPFYISAICLFIAAIVLDITGKRYYTIALLTIAQARQQGQTDRTSIEAASKAALQTGGRFINGGLIIAGLAVISWLCPIGKKKRSIDVIPLILFIVYVMLYFTMV